MQDVELLVYVASEGAFGGVALQLPGAYMKSVRVVVVVVVASDVVVPVSVSVQWGVHVSVTAVSILYMEYSETETETAEQAVQLSYANLQVDEIVSVATVIPTTPGCSRSDYYYTLQ